MGRKCIVPGCGNTDRGKEIMHSLPVEPERYHQWLRIVQREELKLEDRKKYRICDVHFSNEMKVPVYHSKTNLKRLAVPNIHTPSLLGPSEEQHIKENLSQPLGVDQIKQSMPEPSMEVTVSEYNAEFENVAASPENHKTNESSLSSLKTVTPKTPKNRIGK